MSAYLLDKLKRKIKGWFDEQNAILASILEAVHVGGGNGGGSGGGSGDNTTCGSGGGSGDNTTCGSGGGSGDNTTCGSNQKINEILIILHEVDRKIDIIIGKEDELMSKYDTLSGFVSAANVETNRIAGLLQQLLDSIAGGVSAADADKLVAENEALVTALKAVGANNAPVIPDPVVPNPGTTPTDPAPVV